MGNNIIIVDLEATCQDKAIDKNYPMEIIEIGAVKIKNGKIVDEFQTFVRPTLTKELTPFCTELTTITWDDLKDAPPFWSAIGDFVWWIEDLPIASWGWYDAKQFKRDCQLHNNDYRFLNGHRSIKHEYIEMGTGYKGRYYLPLVLQHHGLTFEGTHHRGIDDAKAIAQLYLKLFDK